MLAELDINEMVNYERAIRGKYCYRGMITDNDDHDVLLSFKDKIDGAYSIFPTTGGGVCYYVYVVSGDIGMLKLMMRYNLKVAEWSSI